MFLGGKNLSKKFALVINYSDNKMNQFFSFLRFILYNKANIKDIDTAKPVSVENEIELFNKLREIMKLYLSKYTTTLEYDEDYFKKNKNNMEFNEYNCYVIRIGEKRILHFYLNMSNDILQLLNMSNKNEVKTIFHDIINTCENKNYNMNNKPNQNVVNNLLKYKNYLCYILPLLIVS